jgi:hypothetical protein
VPQAIAATNDTKDLSRTSLGTTMKLFKWKIALVVTYGLEMMWHHRTEKNMEIIEKVKETYFEVVTVSVIIHIFSFDIYYGHGNFLC